VLTAMQQWGLDYKVREGEAQAESASP
jgi:hypothetical protein